MVVELSVPAPSGAVERTIILSDGNSLSWDDLYSDLGPAVLSYARSRGVRDPEDLVQDVFVDLYRRSEDFTGDLSGLRSLLFTIAYRRIADVHRRSARRPEVLMPAPEKARPGNADSGVEDDLVATDTATAAMRALSTLTERERTVIRMRIFEEASPAEVSRRLGLTNVNVRVIQARAFRKVRAALEVDGHLRHPLALAMSATSLRHVASRLPAKGVLGRWVEAVREVTPTDLTTNPKVDPARIDAGSLELWSQTALRAAVGSVIVLGAAGVMIPGLSSRGESVDREPEQPVVAAPVVRESIPPVATERATPVRSEEPAPDTAAQAPAVTSVAPVPGGPSDPAVAWGPAGLVDPVTGTLTLLLADADGVVLTVIASLADQVADTLRAAAEATLAGVSSVASGVVGTTADTTDAVVANVAGVADTTVDGAESVTHDVIATTDELLDESSVDPLADPVEIVDPVDELTDTVEGVADTVDEVMSSMGGTTDSLVDDIDGSVCSTDDGVGQPGVSCEA